MRSGLLPGSRPADHISMSSRHTRVRHRSRRAKQPLPDNLSGDGRSDPSRRFGFGCGLLLFGVGLVAGWFLLLRPAINLLAAQGWREQQCVMESSRVESNHSDDITTYSIEVTYRYEVDGVDYRSDRRAFWSESMLGHSGRQAWVTAHPQGALVPCWVDPGQPREAVLERGLVVESWIALLPVFFMSVGGLWSWVFWRADRKDSSEGWRSAGLAKDPALFDILPEVDDTPGPTKLKATSSRGRRVFQLIFMCLFWNGIVSLFVREVMEGLSRGRPEWLHTLVLVPFVLVGLAFVAAVVDSLLALRNPRPELTLNASATRLGERLEVSWTMHGSTAGLESLSIVLEGRENATYYGHYTPVEVSKVFATLPLLESHHSLQSARGSASLLLPAYTMHSFVASNNEVVWELKLKGSIHRWPDIEETYRVIVLPHDAKALRKNEEA